MRNEKFFYYNNVSLFMAEAVCGFESLAFIGVIIGSVIASVGYSIFKNNKPTFEKEISAWFYLNARWNYFLGRTRFV